LSLEPESILVRVGDLLGILCGTVIRTPYHTRLFGGYI
jgi:hypothetical protein